MPPKQKIHKKEIFEAAFDYVRKNGWSDLSARYLAKQMNCSTMPIYSCFSSMAHLEEEIVKAAMALLYDYMIKARTGDKWIDHSIGVVMFAINEKHLWRSINDEKHVPIRRKYGSIMWADLGERLVDYPPFQGLSDCQVEMIQRARWIFTHGFACLLNNNERPEKKEDHIVHTIRRVSQAILDDFKNDPSVVIGQSLFQSMPPDCREKHET